MHKLLQSKTNYPTDQDRILHEQVIQFMHRQVAAILIALAELLLDHDDQMIKFCACTIINEKADF